MGKLFLVFLTRKLFLGLAPVSEWVGLVVGGWVVGFGRLVVLLELVGIYWAVGWLLCGWWWVGSLA